MTYIYALVDPRTDGIRYVGKSDDPEARLVQHYAESHNRHLRRWLDLLRRKALSPRIMILDRVPSIGWEKYERAWIAAMKQSVGHRLANVHPGGIGGETRLGRTNTAEMRAKISDMAILRRDYPDLWHLAKAGRPWERRLTGHTGKCAICGKDFYAKRSDTMKKYCSRRCYWDSLREQKPWNTGLKTGPKPREVVERQAKKMVAWWANLTTSERTEMSRKISASKREARP